MRIAIVATVVVFLFTFTAPAGASTIDFNWYCDSNCDVAAELGFSTVIELSHFSLDGGLYPVEGLVAWNFLIGEGPSNGLVASQSPDVAAHLVGARATESGILEFLSDAPISFYYGSGGVAMTASGNGVLDQWFVTPSQFEGGTSVGHFAACEDPVTGRCTVFTEHSTQPVPEPSSLLLLGGGLSAVLVGVRKRISVA